MMKISKEFVLRELMGEYIVVPVGKTPLSFNGLITLNEVGSFLWEKLQKDITFEQLVTSLTDTYEVDLATATKDVEDFLAYLAKHQLLENEHAPAK